MANYSGRGFSRRDEIAREKGFASAHYYRIASKAEREAATRDLAARSRDYAKTGAVEQVARAGPAKRRIPLGGDRELVQTMNNRELYAFLKRADAAGLRVFGKLDLKRTIEGDRASETSETVERQTITLWKHGGIDPSYILDELRAAESRDVKGWLLQYVDAAGGNTGGVSGDGVTGWTLDGVQLSSGAVSEGMAA